MRPAGVPGHPSPTLHMAAGVSANSNRGSAISRDSISNGVCGRMETNNRNEICDAQRPNGTQVLLGLLAADQAGSDRRLQELLALFEQVKRLQSYQETISQPTQATQPIQSNVRDERPTSTVEEAGSATQSRELDRSWETEWRKQSSTKVPETIRRVGALDGRSTRVSNITTAMQNSTGGNIAGSHGGAPCMTDLPEETLQRNLHAAIASMCVAPQQSNSDRDIRDVHPTRRYNGHHGNFNEDISSVSVCSTSSPGVDPAPRDLRTSHTDTKVPVNGFLPVSGSSAPSVVNQGVPNAYSSPSNNEWRATTLESDTAREMASMSAYPGALHSTALQSVGLPRVERDRTSPSGASDVLPTGVAQVPLLPFGNASVVLLLEQVLEKAAAALPVSTLVKSLATALASLAESHVRSLGAGGGASSSAPQTTNERDLPLPNCRPEVLRESVRNSVPRREVAAEEMGLVAPVVGIQKLPTGRRLEDYYVIGPVVDIGAQARQVNHPDKGGRLPNKRPLSVDANTQRADNCEEGVTRKVRRLGNFEGNPPEATMKCSGASASRIAGDPIFQTGNQPGVSTERTMMMPMPPRDVIESEERAPPPPEELAALPEETVLLPLSQLPCRTVPGPLKQIPVNNQAQDAADNGARPMLRLAVARSVPLNIPNPPVKIVKSIEKTKIPASAGGERLWRRLCERLLSLPPHPNVLTVDAVVEDSNYYHFIFELLEGGELFSFLLKEKAVDEPICQCIVYQILMALHHLHSHNLLHRDIKPENLVFRRWPQKKPERLPEGCAGRCSQSYYSPSSSSTALPTSSSKGSSNCSPSHLYVEPADGQHSPTTGCGLSSMSSSSASFSTSCTGSSSGLNSSNGCAAGRSYAHHPGSYHFFPNASNSAQRQGVPCSPPNGNTARRNKACEAEEPTIIDHFRPRAARDGHDTVEEQYVHMYHEKRAENMMRQLLRDYELVLIDFDTCKMMDVPTEEYGEIVCGRRRLVGTYGYLAPEVLCGHVYSTQSDLWSVGVILYILMTGMPPIPMEDMVSASTSLNVFVEMHDNHNGIRFDVPPLSNSPLAQDLCQRLLRLSPRERLSSAWEALSHSWFDNLNRLSAQGDSVGVTHFCGIPPVAADESMPCVDPRSRMNVDGRVRCQPAHQPDFLPPLTLPPLREEGGSVAPSPPEGKTPLGFPCSSASVFPQVCPAAGQSTRVCTRLYMAQSEDRLQEQLGPVQGNPA